MPISMLLLRLSFASSAGGLRSNIAKRQRTRLFAVYVSKAIFQREGSSDLDTAALRAIAFLMPLLPPVTSGLFRRVLAYRILLTNRRRCRVDHRTVCKAPGLFQVTLLNTVSGRVSYAITDTIPRTFSAIASSPISVARVRAVSTSMPFVNNLHARSCSISAAAIGTAIAS